MEQLTITCERDSPTREELEDKICTLLDMKQVVELNLHNPGGLRKENLEELAESLDRTNRELDELWMVGCELGYWKQIPEEGEL